MNNSHESLIENYREIYGTPKDDKDAISTICEVFKERMGGTFTMDTKEGIGEYYRLIKERELPAFEWLMEAVHVVSKKDPDKRNFPYVIGVIRDWLKFGFGHMPSDEEKEMLDYFCEITGLTREQVSPEAYKIFQNLMGEYGVMKIMRVIPQLSGELQMDFSKLRALMLKEQLEEKYKKKEG